MDELFASGRAVDIVLGVMVLEALVLGLFGGRPWVPRLAPLLLTLLSGAAAMLALRAALTGSGWPAIAFFLVLSFLFHLADLTRRAYHVVR